MRSLFVPFAAALASCPRSSPGNIAKLASNSSDFPFGIFRLKFFAEAELLLEELSEAPLRACQACEASY